MTTKSSRSGDKQLGRLRWALAAGSVIASLAGTRLVAVKDAAQTAVPAPSAATIVIPAAGTVQQIELAPIPTAVPPAVLPLQPIARTQSSR